MHYVRTWALGGLGLLFRVVETVADEDERCEVCENG